MGDNTFDNWEHFTYINRTISYVVKPDITFNQTFINTLESEQIEQISKSLSTPQI